MPISYSFPRTSRGAFVSRHQGSWTASVESKGIDQRRPQLVTELVTEPVLSFHSPPPLDDNTPAKLHG